MRNALLLLLLLAIAAVPGSVYPQRSADPNGVAVFYDSDPDLAAVLDSLQLFDVYTSVWFSAIYILLFVSLAGCVLPRTKIHFAALRAKPVQTPKSLKRMPQYLTGAGNETVLETAFKILKKRGFRVEKQDGSVSAEKGYAKETGNLLFHYSLVGVLIAVGAGGGLSFSGQRVLVEGDTFVNNLASYDSFSPGALFDESQLEPFSVTLDEFDVIYDLANRANIGQPIDFIASVTAELGDKTVSEKVRVNQPLAAAGANVYLTGNGFAPVVTVFDGEGNITYAGPVVFLPQDNNMTSLGVIKAPDALPVQLGIIAFFYPTAEKLTTGAYTSIYPDPISPLLTMNVYTGDLGLDSGVPRNVYALDTTNMELIAGRDAAVPAIELEVGQSAELPDNLGSVRFDGLLRFASLDVAYNPGGIWVLIFSLMALGSMAVSLMVPRRRVWVKVLDGGKIEYAALSRRDDPDLPNVLQDIVTEIEKES